MNQVLGKLQELIHNGIEKNLIRHQQSIDLQFTFRTTNGDNSITSEFFFKRDQQPMIIAELSANHGQKKSHAFKLIEAAHQAGADAVKVQTYTPDTITFKSEADPFVIKDQKLWKGQSLWELYQKAYTPWEWQPELKTFAESLGLRFIASVFDFTSVDFWEKHGLKIYKIASAEIIDIPLLERVAATGKQIILSTGMATVEEVNEAVSTIQKINPSVDLTLLKCSSAYPAPIESINLSGLSTLKNLFKTEVGLSDHTMEDLVAVTAVGLGATVFEKHIKLEDGGKTPDDAFSLNEEAFKSWVHKIRTAQATLGSNELNPTIEEKGTLPFRKSLFAVSDIQKGEAFTEKNVKSIRPASGLHPREYQTVLTKTAAQNIKAGTPLRVELLS